MTGADCSRILAEVGLRIFEEAAFLFTEPGQAPGREARDPLEATLEFGGPGAGEIRLSTDREVAVLIAANMLGLEKDDPEAAESAEQALGELLNVLGGSLMVDLFGTREVCHLGIPRVGRGEGLPADPQAASVRFQVEGGGQLTLSLEMKGA